MFIRFSCLCFQASLRIRIIILVLTYYTCSYLIIHLFTMHEIVYTLCSSRTVSIPQPGRLKFIAKSLFFNELQLY